MKEGNGKFLLNCDWGHEICNRNLNELFTFGVIHQMLMCFNPSCALHNQLSQRRD